MPPPSIKTPTIDGLGLDKPRSVTFGEVVYEPGGSLGPRIQADVQFVILTAGSLVVTVNDVAHKMAPGQVCCLLPGGVEHFAFALERKSAHRWVSLTYPHMSPSAGNLLCHGPFVKTETAPMKSLLDVGLSLGRAGGAWALAAREHVAVAYLLAYADLAQVGIDNPMPEPVAKARQLMIDRLDEPLTLNELAAAASVTASHLVRTFKTAVGQTPMRMLWELRIQRGAELLRDTGLSVAEVAYRVGFSNPYHFSRRFKAQFGVGPKHWRQRRWATSDTTG